MKIENQVISIEQAKRLTELCIECEAYFNWTYYHEIKYRKGYTMLTTPSNREAITDMGETYPAFTVAELGVMLPVKSGIIGWEVWYSDHLGTWQCTLRDLVKWKGGGDAPPIAYESEGDTMAEAMADTLIHCLETSLTTPQEINNRLKQ
jgi:hypothetical protein